MIVLAAWSATVGSFFYRKGCLLYYGDAEAHLNIARRVFDSRTPGWDQLGTVWLPLPHILMLPLVVRDQLWKTGLAGTIPSSACFVIAGVFLFAAVRRIFQSGAAAAAATAVFALNPNVLYLQSTPMTEPVFFAAFLGLLYFTVRFRQKQTLASVLGAGLAAVAGTLTRYEAWFVLPFAAFFFLWADRRRRPVAALVFSSVACLGPLFWLAYNRWYFGDWFEFYRGPFSAQAIQGTLQYPGNGDWRTAWLYLRTAARWCLGAPLSCLMIAGIAAALWKKAIWPVLVLGLPPAFYLWSIHSAHTPIFVPDLWPHSYYNTRYGLAFFPLAAFSSAALVAVAPRKLRAVAAIAAIAISSAVWIAHPREEAWITWKESEVNSEARRGWTARAATFLRSEYRSGAGIFTSFGDLTGIYRQAGIPLRATLTGDNGPHWPAAAARPDLFLWDEWAVAMGGDKVQTAINRARRRGPNYVLAETIMVKGAPVIEIYRRAEYRGPE